MIQIVNLHTATMETFQKYKPNNFTCLKTLEACRCSQNHTQMPRPGLQRPSRWPLIFPTSLDNIARTPLSIMLHFH